MNDIKLDGKYDLMVENNTNGDVFAIIKKGKYQTNRLMVAIKEEFDNNVITIENIYSDNDSLYTFTVNLEEGGIQDIKLRQAFIY